MTHSGFETFESIPEFNESVLIPLLLDDPLWEVGSVVPIDAVVTGLNPSFAG